MANSDQVKQLVSSVVDLKKPGDVKGTPRSFAVALRSAFHQFDTDHSNTIDRDELGAMLRSLGKRPTERKIDSIFDTLDINKDGEIDFSEFCKYFTEQDTEDDPSLYCHCQKPSGGVFMIACDAVFDGCFEWYHGRCVGVRANSPETEGVWFCPICKSKAPKKHARKTVAGWTKIKGKRYDKAMIEIVNQARGKKVGLKLARELAEAIFDDGIYSRMEKDTLKYIQAHYNFTAKANEWLNDEIAAKTGKSAKAAPKTTSKATPKAKPEAEKEKKKEKKVTKRKAASPTKAKEKKVKTESPTKPKKEKAKAEKKKKTPEEEAKDKAVIADKTPVATHTRSHSDESGKKEKSKEDGKEDDKKEKKKKKTQAEEALEKLSGEQKEGERTVFATEDRKKFRSQLLRVFRQIDVDKSNTIDKLELARMFKKIGRKPTGAKIDAIFTILDTNNDGTINFDEFVKYFQPNDAPPDTTLYCTCKQVHGGRFMIECDAGLEDCLGWYHGDCVGIKEGEAPKTWFCHICSSKAKDSGHVLKKTGSIVQIQKQKYDNEMLHIAQQAVDTHGAIRVEDAKALTNVVLADGEYSNLEKRTIRYIRKNFKFTDEADKWYRHTISSWASRIGHLTQSRRQTSDPSQLYQTPATPVPTTPVQAMSPTQQSMQPGTPIIPMDLTSATPRVDPAQYQQLQYLPQLVVPSPEDELKIKAQILKWFEENPSEGIRKLAPEIKAMEFKAIMAVTKEDWQMMAGVLPGISIVYFLQSFQAVWPLYYLAQGQ